MKSRLVSGGSEGVTEAAEREGKAKRVPAGSLLLSFKLSLGRVGITACDVFTNEAIAWVRPGDRVQRDFLALALENLEWEQFGSRAVKGRTLNAESLDALPITLPPLDEQRRIVDLMGTVDDAIDAANLQTASLRQTASALRRKLFSELSGTCPESTAGQFFEVTLGRQKSARQLHGDHEIPYIRSANILDGSLSLSDVQSMNFDPKEQAKYSLQNGDVLVVEGGSIGQTAVWKSEIQGPVGFDKHVLRVRGLMDISTSGFANQWARWCYETGRFEAQARGVTIKALGFQRAKDMPVPAPPVARQMEVTDILDSCDEAATSSMDAVDSLRLLRTELLSALLSGAHRIPETYDELMGADSMETVAV
jgi:type I restriction enzyme S subunit